MLDKAAEINKLINSFIEGVPAMVCIIGMGLLLFICFLHSCVNRKAFNYIVSQSPIHYIRNGGDFVVF